MSKLEKPKIDKRQACEIYSRVVGYIRPVKQWNEGKQQEFGERKEFDKQICGCSLKKELVI